MAKSFIVLKDGVIVEIPEECGTLESILEWLDENYGENSAKKVSKIELYFPEIDETLKFSESKDGRLVSETTLTKEEFSKISKKHPDALTSENKE